MFFVLYEDIAPSIIRDEKRKVSYAVLNVVNPNILSISSVSDSSSSEDSSNEDMRRSVRNRMVDQFIISVGMKEDYSMSYSISDFCNPSIEPPSL